MANNVITATFPSSMGSQLTYADPVYQYDYGMILQFVGLSLPMAYEVHFANTDSTGNSITQIGNEDGVSVPDELLLTGKTVYAWVYLHSTVDDGETVYKVVIPVNRRARPTNATPTPVQQDVITEAIAALDAAVEEAQAAVEAIQDMGVDAEQLPAGSEPTVTKTVDPETGVVTLTFGLVDGEQGETGVGIQSISWNPDYTMTVTMTNGTTYTSGNLRGPTGAPGNGIASAVLNQNYTLTLTFTDGTSYTTPSIRGAQGEQGIQGIPGADGQSASITGASASVDANVGTPSVAVTAGGTALARSFDFAFHNLKGQPGQDGISPVITVTEITGGHEVAVTDAQGTQTFDVMDGQDGQSGLITDYIAEEKTPYLFRPSANGLANVISEKDMIVGGTVAWNQLVQNGDFSDTSNWTAYIGQGTFTVQNNIGEITGAVTNAYLYQAIDAELNHVFLVGCDLKATKNISSYFSFGTTTIGTNDITTSWARFLKIGKKTSTSVYVNFIRIQSELTASDKVNIRNAILIDLTQMFGSTIADYLYTLEQNTSGSGISKAKSWGYFLKDYYPYSEGALQSVQTSAHRMVGKNQFDQDNAGWVTGKYINASGVVSNNGQYKYTDEYTKVNASTQYAISCTKLSSDNVLLTVCFYDSEKTFIERVQAIDFGSSTGRKSGTFTTTSGTAFIRFSTVYNSANGGSTDFQIEFGSTATAYEPYSVHSYPLDSDLVLRGVLKLDASNNLRYDGDVYKCDGTVTRKYGTVDLGTLSWTVEVASTGLYYSNVNAIKLRGVILNAQGWTCQQSASLPSWEDKSVGATNSQAYLLLRIKDSAYANMTASQFKTAMSGKYIVYELATETTEQADPYSEYQIVDADGTEEYVDERTVPIPVGHDTYYQQSVDVPQLPTTDGAYRLALSKTGSTATASWEYVAQAEMKAQANIPSGKYFSVGERLFISTQAIAQGANIVPGTNCTETTLADALNTINA